MSKVNKKLILIIFLFLVLNNSTQIFGFWKANQNENLIYSASPILNKVDHFVYLSMVEQGREGKIFSKLLYNHQAEKNYLFSPHWYLTGQLANFLNLSSAGAYFLLKILLSILFILITWEFLRKIFPKNKALITIFIILFSNGLGNLFNYFFENSNIIPSNLWILDTITFMAFRQGPIFILSQIMILSIFLLFVKALEENKNKFIWLGASINLILSLIHPYDAIITTSVLSIFLLIKYYINKKNKNIFALILLYTSSGLAGFYYVITISNDTAMQQWKIQNQLLSGPIVEYIIGMGIIFILATLAIVYITKKRLFENNYLNLVYIWAVLTPFLLYIPIDFNRRLANGWHIPLAILSSIFLFLIIKNISGFKKYLLLIMIAFLLFNDTTSFLALNYYVIKYDPEYALFRNQESINLFHNKERQKIYDYIKNHSQDDDVIMTRGSDGASVPAFTARKVYAGHMLGTWQYYEKSLEIKKTWSQINDISSWLVANKIKYIFASSLYINEFEKIKWLAKENYISPIVDNENFILYEFITP